MNNHGELMAGRGLGGLLASTEVGRTTATISAINAAAVTQAPQRMLITYTSYAGAVGQPLERNETEARSRSRCCHRQKY